MRAALAIGLCVAVAALLLWWSQRDDVLGNGAGGNAGAQRPVVEADGAQADPGTGQHANDRTAQGLPAPAGIAALTVIDAATRAPVAGADVWRYRDRQRLGRSDAEGRVAVALPQTDQLVVGADGFLLQACIAVPAGRDGPPQTVELQPDRFGLRCRFRFPGVSAGETVHARFLETLDNRSAATALSERTRDQGLAVQQAYAMHATLAGFDEFRPHLLQLAGVAPRTLELTHDAVVRFVAGGNYRLFAWHDDGRCAVVPFTAEQVAEAGMTVSLQPGATLRGQIQDAAGHPLAGAQAIVEPQLLFAREARAAADGTFELAGLPPTIELRLQLVELEPLTVQTPCVASPVQRFVMQRIPLRELRGAVVARGDRRGVAATVRVVAGEGRQWTTTCAADGTFALRAPLGELQLEASAPGFVTWSELIGDEAPFLNLSLWPDTTDARVRAGLAGVLRGRVLGPDGAPRVVEVRWSAAAGGDPPGSGLGRRVLAGDALNLPRSTASGADGSFAFEVAQPGAVQVTCGPAGGGGESRSFDVILGGHVEVELRVR